MDDVEDYLKYRKRCDGLELTAEQMDFEDFLAFLDVEHRLGLRGSDTWSEDGNEGQVVVKSLIGRILTERCPAANSVPSLYLRFASLLQPDDARADVDTRDQLIFVGRLGDVIIGADVQSEEKRHPAASP